MHGLVFNTKMFMFITDPTSPFGFFFLSPVLSGGFHTCFNLSCYCYKILIKSSPWKKKRLVLSCRPRLGKLWQWEVDQRIKYTALWYQVGFSNSFKGINGGFLWMCKDSSLLPLHYSSKFLFYIIGRTYKRTAKR